MVKSWQLSGTACGTRNSMLAADTVRLWQTSIQDGCKFSRHLLCRPGTAYVLTEHVQQALAEPGQGLRGSDTVVAAADVSAAALSILQLLLLHPLASVCGRSLREQIVLDLAAAGLQSAGYISVCVQDATAFLARFLPHA